MGYLVTPSPNCSAAQWRGKVALPLQPDEKRPQTGWRCEGCSFCRLSRGVEGVGPGWPPCRYSWGLGEVFFTQGVATHSLLILLTRQGSESATSGTTGSAWSGGLKHDWAQCPSPHCVWVATNYEHFIVLGLSFFICKIKDDFKGSLSALK